MSICDGLSTNLPMESSAIAYAWPILFWLFYGIIHVTAKIYWTPNWRIRENAAYVFQTVAMFTILGVGAGVGAYIVDILGGTLLPAQFINGIPVVIYLSSATISGSVIGYTVHEALDIKLSWTDKTDYSEGRVSTWFTPIWAFIEDVLSIHPLSRIAVYIGFGAVLMLPYLLGLLTNLEIWYVVGLLLSAVGFVMPQPFKHSNSSDTSSSSDRPNIVVCMVDDLRRDRTSLHGYDLQTTPVLDRLANNDSTHVFSNAISSGTRSADSIPSLLSGAYASQHQHGNNDEITYLSEELAEEGYATSAISGNTYLNWYRYSDKFDEFTYLFSGKENLFGIQKIITTVYSFLTDTCRPASLSSVDAEFVTELASSFVEKQSKSETPFFLFLTYMDVHSPYVRSQEAVESFAAQHGHSLDIPSTFVNHPSFTPESQNHQDVIQWGYDESIQYVDHQLGELIRSVESTDHSNDTVFIITSDHGELLGDYGVWGHPATPHNELLEVPLVIRDPTQRLSVEERDLFSTVRLPDVIFNLADITPSNQYLEQRQMFQSHPQSSDIPAVIDAYPLPGEDIPSPHRLGLLDGWKCLQHETSQYFEYEDAGFESPIPEEEVPESVKSSLANSFNSLDSDLSGREGADATRSRMLQQQLEDLGYL